MYDIHLNNEQKKKLLVAHYIAIKRCFNMPSFIAVRNILFLVVSKSINLNLSKERFYYEQVSLTCNNIFHIPLLLFSFLSINTYYFIAFGMQLIFEKIACCSFYFK